MSDINNIFQIYVNMATNKEIRKKELNQYKDDFNKNFTDEMFIKSYKELPTLLKSFRDDKDKKKEYKVLCELLTDNPYFIKTRYFNNISELYETTITLNNLLNLESVPTLYSKGPSSAIYGYLKSEESKIVPLDGEYVIKIIDAEIFLKRFSTAGRWIYTALNYSKEELKKTLGSVPSDTDKKSTQMVDLVTENVSTKQEYRKALGEYLIEDKDGLLLDLIKTKIDSANGNTIVIKKNEKLNKELEELKNKVETLQQANHELTEELQKAQRLNSSIEAIKKEAENYKNKNFEFYNELQKQIEINSKLENKIASFTDEYTKKLEELQQLNKHKEEEIQALNRNNTNLEADLLNIRNRVTGITDNVDEVINKAKADITGDIIISIKDYLDHFTKAFNLFSTQQEFDKDTLDFCIDDMKDLVSSLKTYQVTTIGEFNEIVNYDNTIHHCEVAVNKGDKVRVVNVGWKVCDNVISKAEVEKMED